MVYGLIGKMIAVEGKREDLAQIMLAGSREMPGCHSYIIAYDKADENAIWITEVWETQQHHADSLELPGIQAAIAKGRPLIAGFGERFETNPIKESL